MKSKLLLLLILFTFKSFAREKALVGFSFGYNLPIGNFREKNLVLMSQQALPILAFN